MQLRTFILIFGFILFISGVLSLVLILIGANLTILAWIDQPGSPRGMIIRILMIGGGLMMAYFALNPIQEEEEKGKQKDDTTPVQ